jgi:beta-lactamase class A
MTAASVVKLQILETLLLDDGAKHATLSDQQDADATAMMDNSDNDAADAVFDDVGDTAGLVAAQSALGLSAATVPGPDDQWGLTTTSAGEQLALLNDLVAANSPLDANERGYALNLMQNVESDQRWGAPAAADPGTAFAVKDGWLALDGDNDLWAVNSDAVVTVHGQQVLISVLTQHDASEQDGITLAQSLAAAAAAAVSGAG